MALGWKRTWLKTVIPMSPAWISRGFDCPCRITTPVSRIISTRTSLMDINRRTPTYLHRVCTCLNRVWTYLNRLYTYLHTYVHMYAGYVNIYVALAHQFLGKRFIIFTDLCKSMGNFNNLYLLIKYLIVCHEWFTEFIDKTKRLFRFEIFIE